MSARLDSNQEPQRYKLCALTIELRADTYFDSLASRDKTIALPLSYGRLCNSRKRLSAIVMYSHFGLSAKGDKYPYARLLAAHSLFFTTVKNKESLGNHRFVNPKCRRSL